MSISIATLMMLVNAMIFGKSGSKCETDALQIIRDVSNAFMNKFINPEVHLMAWQTRNIAGKPIELIPATPDAEPGYHTGLSIIDFSQT